MNQEINLGWGEHITSVEGRAGEVIDHLTISTSSGNTYSFGGHGGHHFKVHIPHGHQVVAFYGGVGGHLHSIGVYHK